MGVWGMYSGFKANEKHNGGNEKILEWLGDPILTPYRPLRGLKFYFCIWLFIYPLNFAAANYPA